ncbi:hypothetical protein SGRIM128S_05538 [Streptomyces griseomycini]
MTSPQVDKEAVPEEGYERGLNSRQVQMIAIGGAIGVGLFLGAGANIAKAGPSLIVMYALAGVIIFFIMRALGATSCSTAPSRAPSPSTRASSSARSSATSPAGRTG